MSKIGIINMFIAGILLSVAACGNQQGMMQGSSTMNMAYWNWWQITFGLLVGFFLGFLVARRKR